MALLYFLYACALLNEQFRQFSTKKVINVYGLNSAHAARHI